MLTYCVSVASWTKEQKEQKTIGLEISVGKGQKEQHQACKNLNLGVD